MTLQSKQTNEGGWRTNRAAVLTVTFVLLLLGLSTVQLVYRYFLPTDGWFVGEAEIDSTQLEYYVDIVGAPSGLAELDVLFALEGRDLESYPPGQTPAFWREGATLTYGVVRDGQPLDVTVTLTNWTLAALLRIQTLLLTNLFATLGMLVLLGVSFLAFFRQYNDPAARALLIFVAAFSANTISGFLPVDLSVILNPFAYVMSSFFSFIIFGALLAPALLSFTLVFPHPNPAVLRRPWLAYAPFLLGAIILIVIVTTGFAEIGWYGTMLMFMASIISLAYNAVTQRDAVSRAQLLWGFGGFILGISLLLLNFPPAFNWVPDSWGYPMSVVASLGIPVIGLGLAMAVMRYRLFDIDVIIRRTTSYAILTVLLALVYFGSVVVLQRLFTTLTGQSSTIAIVLSTLLIAALFLPLRRRVQGSIDRRFFRSKYDAQKTLEAFAATVRDETDLDALTAELVRVIEETMQPEHVSVWLAPDSAGEADVATIREGEALHRS